MHSLNSNLRLTLSMFRREWDFTTSPVTFRLRVVSSKRQATGEDYPAAAGKHCDDAGALLAASRFDGAAYLAGYAVECMLKTVIQVEQGTVAPVLQHRHNLDNLSGEALNLATLPSARTCRYLKNLPITVLAYGTPPSCWKETLRYFPVGTIREATARDWCRDAQRLYVEIIGGMAQDGEITL